MSRTGNAIRNSIFGILSKGINLILAFVSRTIFIHVLGTTYLGVNGLYSEILTLLSFAELGFGSAMTFAMYKPAAEHDEEKIIKLLDYYKRIYHIVAAVIAAAGLAITPFLQDIIRGADYITVRELRVYFLLYLFNTVISYFVSYKFSYLKALQKDYIETYTGTIVNLAANIAQILVLVTTGSFLAYLLANSAIQLASRFVLYLYLDKRFPILARRPAENLTREEKEPILHEVRGLVVHQFSSAAVHSTDNILISALTSAGVATVGLISNYNVLMNAVLGFVTIIFNSVTSGFGNLVAASTTRNFKKVFKEINFLNYWIYGFCTISFWILIPPFISLWIGPDKRIDNISFFLIVVNCYLQGQSTTYNNARIAKGDFNRDKFWAFLQAIVNLVVSIVGARYCGLVGIYIGTIVSRMVYVVFRPYSTYAFLFEESSSYYYKTLLIYILRVMVSGCLTYAAARPLLARPTWRNFLAACLADLIISNGALLALSLRDKEFAAWKARVRSFIGKKGGPSARRS